MLHPMWDALNSIPDPEVRDAIFSEMLIQAEVPIGTGGRIPISDEQEVVMLDWLRARLEKYKK